MQKLTVAELAGLLEGAIEGEEERLITGVAPVERAGSGDLTFVTGPRYARSLLTVSPAAVLAPPDLPLGSTEASVIRVENPRLAFGRALRVLIPDDGGPVGVAPTAVIGEGARLGPGVSIGHCVVVESGAVIGRDSRIGAHTVISSGARIGRGCVVGTSCSILGTVVMGDRVEVQTGARIGTEGYGYADEDDRLGTRSYGGEDPTGDAVKVPQVGRCIIGDDVEIGANVTIDRGALGDTVVGARTKIDNLVHVGHNVRIGDDCMIVAQVGVAGSVEIGDRVQLAGQAGIAGHLEIGDGARIAAQAGVIGDVPPGATYSGYPARPHGKAMRANAAFFRLPELLRRVRALERALEAKGGEADEERRK